MAITLRMLVPRELHNAQDFPPGYLIDRTVPWQAPDEDRPGSYARPLRESRAHAASCLKERGPNGTRISSRVMA